ncbi:hypothetical protein M3Y98_00722600 [Aphelenchoides besseyi]|nr:hypothetical protein M3Y98_00722600 [Aphelenchoides besseyi]
METVDAQIDANGDVQPTSTPPPSPLPATQETIAEGDYAIVRKLDGKRFTLTRLKKNVTIAVENLNFKVDAALGQPYGVYQVLNRGLKPEIPVEGGCKSLNVLDEEEEPVEGQKHQLVRGKVDLKRAKKGHDVDSNRTSNHTHVNRLLLPAESRDSLFPQVSDWTNVLSRRFRNDHVSLMMQMAAVKPNARVLVYDQSSGVVVTHVVERLGGFGACVLLHNGPSASHILCYRNRQFPKDVKELFGQKSHEFPLQISVTFRPLPVGRLLGNEEVKSEKVEEALSWFEEARTPGFGRFDSLLIVCKNASAVSVLEKTFRAVRSAGNLVVYSPNSAVSSTFSHANRRFQDVVLAREWLEKRGCVFVEIRQSFCREIQVLKRRTHPLMQQQVPGGYILSAIRVFDP